MTGETSPVRCVALLRGVNVGGHRGVVMSELRALLTGLGHTDVRTHLQIGNAVFTAAAGPTDRIAAEIGGALGGVKVMVRTAAELRGVVERNPLPVRDPARLLVAFLDAPVDRRALRAVDLAAYAPEEVRAGERELYYHLPGGAGRARLPAAVERRLGVPVTARNWNTVVRLLEMAES
ncbi:DUF1697 domain-containing protein [Streptomyces capparidis]